ncbi:zinc-ribbon domain-containing protein [Thalassovita sp.]|uniref:zinc-ribbon domain-containing protein n=1 Tax=Thalassovita sp. TaxID=1979401 RepID=UPI0029DE7506|nr:zinc-ribbon domain-containing protein [Thalassovita sp.]
MRLICPNCGAQYEVPDGVIPVQGRDVQCSNCGHTWFQPHPDDDPDLTEELGQEPAPKPKTAPAPPPEPEAWNEPEDEYDETYEDEPAPVPAPAPAEKPAGRRELDPTVAELLREEAELEARLRAQEAPSGLEMQTELGLDDPAPDTEARRAEEARRRMASRKGLDEDQDEVEEEDDADLDAQIHSRRELLPDIEEINSSLNADARRPARADDHKVPGAGTAPRSGFRAGFVLGVLVIAILWSIYAFADQLGAQVPQLEGALQQYAALVDAGRGWLDEQVKALLIKLDAMAAASEK